MSNSVLLLLVPLVFSAVLAVIGAVARSVDPRQARRRRLQRDFEATKDRPESTTHQTADILWTAYLRQEAENSDTHSAAGWARNSNIMWLFASGLLVGTFAVGVADPTGDVGETKLSIWIPTMFESSTLGAVFALTIGSGLLAIIFAVISLCSNKQAETEREHLKTALAAVQSDAKLQQPGTVGDSGHPPGGPPVGSGD